MRPVDACLLDGPRMVGTGANFTQIWVYSSSVVLFCARVALCRAMNDEKGRVQHVIPDDAVTRQMELCFKTRNRLLPHGTVHACHKSSGMPSEHASGKGQLSFLVGQPCARVLASPSTSLWNMIYRGGSRTSGEFRSLCHCVTVNSVKNMQAASDISSAM